MHLHITAVYPTDGISLRTRSGETARTASAAGKLARTTLYSLCLLLFIFLCALRSQAAGFTIESASFRYEFDHQGKNISFKDKAGGKDYLKAHPSSYMAYVTKDNREFNVSAAQLDGSVLRLRFGPSGVVVSLDLTFGRKFVSFEVKNVEGDPESLTFLNIPLTLDGMPDDAFAACALSMNLQTHVFQLPALQTHLKATCYKRFGLEKAKITLTGVPQAEILPVIRQIMQNAKDIPFSDVGGAWAQLSKEGYGSYLMNFGTLTESTVDDWIKMCRSVGFNQIDHHGGAGFFRFGDFEPDRKKWPEGWENFKRINKRLHEAGISSIFHTYAFFLDKDSKYVTPVPHPDLGYFKAFTLAAPLGEKDTAVFVNESTAGISLTTGFFVRNSRTLRINGELIEFTGVSDTPPYRFTGCKRGALGTTAFTHHGGEKAYHLREMFGRFLPGGDTGLFSEIARRTAEIVDQAGFDGIYLDAIDGSDILAGSENFWYYGGKFVFEIARHLQRPVGMEMSSMLHHWWHYRSRWQAWDRPVRGYKRFIDIHSASIKSDEYEHGLWRGHTPLIDKLAQAENGGLLLPLQLGWWGHQTWNPPQIEPTFPDDIEYLGAKMIGNNAGLAMLGGFYPEAISETPAFGRLNAIIRKYEILRQKNYFSDSIRAVLRRPGKDFTLFQQKNGAWNFRPVCYLKQKVSGLTHPSSRWKVNNPHGKQLLKARIELLMSIKPYTDTAGILLSDSAAGRFAHREMAEGVAGTLTSSSETTTEGDPAMRFSAKSSGASDRDASWIKIEKRFEPALDLDKNQGLGVWIKGDGNGQLLNIRLESPHHISHGARGDHFITVDFTGWKYVELVETESSEFSRYKWPAPVSSSSFYVYDSYRHTVSFKAIDKIQLWYNSLPAGKHVNTVIGPVKALPLEAAEITNPALTLNGRTITFPVAMESGMYLEFLSATDCKLYDPKGNLLREITLAAPVPLLENGENQISFQCSVPQAVSPRVQVTLISEGPPLIPSAN